MTNLYKVFSIDHEQKFPYFHNPSYEFMHYLAIFTDLVAYRVIYCASLILRYNLQLCHKQPFL